MKKVLITGVAGFLGSCVLNEFTKQAYQIITTDTKDIAGNNYFKADITSREQLATAFPEMNFLIHVAGLAHVFNPGQDTEELFDKVNHQGTRNLFEVAAEKGARHAVLISSVSVYKKQQGFVTEDDSLDPLTAYARSKLAAEKAAIEIAQKSGMKLTILRLATLYGPGDPGNVARLIRQIASGRFLMIGAGGNQKSLLHVRDAARACRVAIEKQQSKIEIFNVSDQPRPMIEIINAIRQMLGKSPVPLSFPLQPALLMTQLAGRLPFVGRKFASINDTINKFTTDDAYSAECIKQKLGFICQEDFAAGIKEEIDFLASATHFAALSF